MDIFSMWDIISLLGLPGPTNGRSSYYIQCPCCDGNPHKKHLNVNLKKEVFRCPKCGVSGGIFDLYALYTGTPRDKVRKELVERIGTHDTVIKPKSQTAAFTAVQSPAADIDIRNKAYTALLSRMTLDEEHKENLLNRGLTEQEIEKLGYKTVPDANPSVIAGQLHSENIRLSGVPGFYKDDSGLWSFIHEKRGILIPVRDFCGRIQGIQIRRDSAAKRKFRWVSSAELKDGCPAEGWTHLAGKLQPLILLTEGPMKADIINSLTGLTVLAVPGVNSLTHLKTVLDKLKSEGVTEIKTAFDMDFIMNHNVQNGYQALLALLDEMGFLFGTYLWDPRYKGLDDFVWEYCLKRQRG